MMLFVSGGVWMSHIFKSLFYVSIIMISAVAAASAEDQQFYRWVDESGTVHYGDRVPPQYAKTERNIVNNRGVTVGNLAAEKSAEELAIEHDANLKAEADRRKVTEARQRDAVLLSTYLSIEEIEALRNRRMELIDGQIRVTELYLSNLREKRGKLENEAGRFRPYSPKPEAPPLPDNLARELSDTLDSIILYEKNLDDARTQQNQLVVKFDADISRFKSLKGLN